MKNINYLKFLCPIVLALSFGNCTEDGFQGILKISITDSPIDAADVKSVNIVITNLEGLHDGKWKSFRNFEQPQGVNLLAYTGGKSVLIMDAYANPGSYEQLRLSLKVASRNSSLIINPQSNIVFSDGSSASLYLAEGKTPEITLDQRLSISAQSLTDLTLDFDLRKSIQLIEGEYLLNPVIRVVDTRKAGHIEAVMMNNPLPDNLVAFVYKAGTFNISEAGESAERVSFFNAITSTSVSKEEIDFGFLEAGSYDLVFVKHDDSGKIQLVKGRQNGVEVKEGEKTALDIDLGKLSPP